MPENWFIGLDAWIIRDGNYPDFRVGQTCLFAVEFIPEGALRVATGNQEVQRDADDRYLVTARVVASAQAVECYVLDLGGLMVYGARPGGPEQFVEGETVQGRVQLGVDPYDYFETLGYRNDIPPPIYQWTIVRLFRQGPPQVEIEGTDTWHDDVEITSFGVGTVS